MAPVAKNTENHPANLLTIGSPELVTALTRVHPITLPNHGLLQTDELVRLRTLVPYMYVVLWLYQCRGFVKLQDEYFDVDIFELELLNHFPLTLFLMGLDDYDALLLNNLFITKLKLALMLLLQNQKLSLIANFERVYRVWFGVNTPLRGTEVEDEDGNVVPIDDPQNEVRFDDLTITAKFDILHNLIATISDNYNFRRWVESLGLSLEQLRPETVLTTDDGHTQQCLQLFYDDTYIYSRTVDYPKLVEPKKRLQAPRHPDLHYGKHQFDVDPPQYRLVVANVYELELMIKQLRQRDSRDAARVASALALAEFVDNVIECEIRKRKFIAQKKKELELAGMIALRKRLLRLEAKQRRDADAARLRQLELAELRLGAQQRIERRRQQRAKQLYQEQVARDARTTSTPDTPDTTTDSTMNEPIKDTTLPQELSPLPVPEQPHLRGVGAEVAPPPPRSERPSTTDLAPAPAPAGAHHDASAHITTGAPDGH